MNIMKTIWFIWSALSFIVAALVVMAMIVVVGACLTHSMLQDFSGTIMFYGIIGLITLMATGAYWFAKKLEE